MIVITCATEAKPGREDEMVAMMAATTRAARSHPGVVTYFWTADAGRGRYTDVEVFEDEAALLGHIALTDGAQFECMDVLAIDVFGPPPSAALEAELAAFGQYAYHLAV